MVATTTQLFSLSYKSSPYPCRFSPSLMLVFFLSCGGSCLIVGELHLALHQQICQTSSGGTRPFSLHCEALSLKAFGCPIQREIKTAISMAAFPMEEGFFCANTHNVLCYVMDS